MTPIELSGNVRIDRVVETEGLGFFPGFLLPDASDDAIAGESSWLCPHFFDPGSGRFVQSVQGYLIRTSHHTILVDTCVGNDKERPSSRAWHQQSVDWLGRLRALGTHPADIDFVLCTHLHVDHVGWNTCLADGVWVPTFPKAKYVFHRREYDFWEREREMPVSTGYGRTEGSFEDSVLPVVEAGLAQLVDDDFALGDNVWVDPTPGHSPGHICINIASDRHRLGRHPDAVCSGDLLHHPIQCAFPEWNSRYCWDPAKSRATRAAFVERYRDTATRILAAHFATPTAGRIRSNGERARFAVDPD